MKKKNCFKRSPVYGQRSTVRGVALATTRGQIVLWQKNKFQRLLVFWQGWRRWCIV